MWVGGGEPTLRADLPALLQGLGDRLQGLATDGWALGRPQTVAHLQAAGLGAVRIPFHSANAAAHDWLAGTPGAWKRAWQALRTCVAAGLAVDAEVVLTRPTLLHLDDTLGLLARLELNAIVVRPLDGETPDYPAVAARQGLTRVPLERAVAIARDAGRSVFLEGFPACGVGVLDDLRVRGRPLPGQPCGQCPGPPDCHGVPHAYLAAFGWQDVPAPATRADVVTVAIEIVDSCVISIFSQLLRFHQFPPLRCWFTCWLLRNAQALLGSTVGDTVYRFLGWECTNSLDGLQSSWF